jgi:hypothetical protein
MTRGIHTFKVDCPIPSNISATSVITALHCHENLLTLQPQLSSYSEISSTQVPDFDEYFDKLSGQVKVYKAIERITLLPGIGDMGKYSTTIVVSFQDAADGLRSRAVAPAGIIVTSTYIVHRIKSKSAIFDTHDEDKTGHDNWTLSQNVILECPSWLMPFVKQNMEGAQRYMCQNLIKKISS